MQPVGKKQRRFEVVGYGWFWKRYRVDVDKAFIPVFMVGSGNGANMGECSEGSAVPLVWASFTLAGSAAPSQNMQMGTFLPGCRAKRLKSSPTIDGGVSMILSFPKFLTSTSTSF